MVRLRTDTGNPDEGLELLFKVAAMRFEIECYNKLVPTEDRREGIRAFNEKRKPEFRGR